MNILDANEKKFEIQGIIFEVARTFLDVKERSLKFKG